MDKEICIGFINDIVFIIFWKYLCSKRKQIKSDFDQKNIFCEKENKICLLIKMEFDGEKVPKTYENEF